MDVLKNTLRAFTLVESLVSTTILTVAFAIGMMVVGWVITADPLPLKEKALRELQSIRSDWKQYHVAHPQVFEHHGFQIEQQLLPYGSMTNVWQLVLIASTPDGTLQAELRELIYYDHE